jgi:hypothetical protein
MSPLWMTIEPHSSGVRLVLTEPGSGPSLKAWLPFPSQARAVPMLLEALCHWHRRPLRAVLDADAEDVRLSVSTMFEGFASKDAEGSGAHARSERQVVLNALT